MPSEGLVRVFEGRPTFVEKDGGRIFVTVHDQFYLSELARLKEQVRNTHPDRRRFFGLSLQSGRIKVAKRSDQLKLKTHGTFRAAVQQLDMFVRREVAYYHSLGLTPPKVGRRS